MHWEELLSDTLHKEDVNRFASIIGEDYAQFQKLYKLIRSEDSSLSRKATWIVSKVSNVHPEWFEPLRKEMLELIQTPGMVHGTVRQLLYVFNEIPMEDPIDVELLDFCLNNMFNPQYEPGIQSLCLKIAHRRCLTEPELQREFNLIVDDRLPFVTHTGVRGTAQRCRKNQIQKKKKTT